MMDALCHLLGLGQLKQGPIRVAGGLLHTMWHLETTQGTFALKELSPNIDLTNQIIVQNYNLTEHIAWQFKEQGIPAIPAIGIEGHYLTLYNNTGYLLYPWVDARSLDADKISEPHALKIAALLARMHNLNLRVPELSAPILENHSNEKMRVLIKQALASNCPYAEQLQQYENELLACNRDYQQVIPLLKKQAVVSHGDLDQKNVLWNADLQPLLIDWESARLINPTYEIVNASLDWSGITFYFNHTLFESMLAAYQQAGGKIDHTLLMAALNGVLGNWINWLVYNIERSNNPTDTTQKDMGCEQVAMVVPTILRVKRLREIMEKKV
jgi:thiamine kinase-like enzyme